MEGSVGRAKVLGWQWDFRPIGTDSIRFPTPHYDKVGEYDVTLVVTDERGCKDTLTRPNYIHIVPSPEPDIFPSDISGCVPFDGKLSVVTRGNTSDLIEWNWDLGNGQQHSGSHIADFSYPVAGTYLAAVTVTDRNQCSGEAQVELQAFPTPDFDIMASDSFGCAPFNVSFFAVGDPEHPIVAWQWDFGDGGQSSDSTPTYQYQQDGIYGVSLAVQDSNGCEAVFEKDPYIHLSHPIAGFAVVEDVVCPGEAVQILGQYQTDTALVSWNWDFGDGSTSQEERPLNINIKCRAPMKSPLR